MSPRPADSTDSRSGVIAGLAAYALWGMMPLYFAALRGVPAYEILAQRVVWCALFLAVLLTATGRWADLVRACRSAHVLRSFLLTSVLLSINWYTYIYGVRIGRTVETSLGYFINPLLNVALGYLFFRERLRPLQLGALALALAGVLNLVVAAEEFPWIALTVATSFALYGVLRKTAPADALVGLAIETFILLPPAAVFAAYLAAAGSFHLGTVDRTTDALLLASGAITAVPLLCFGVAARNLRLTTLGFLQYIAPSAQLLLAILVLGETVVVEKWLSFACIWIALAIYSLDAWRGSRPARRDGAVARAGHGVPAVSQTS
jgi:chloramphenicol-sensitive protein RarD